MNIFNIKNFLFLFCFINFAHAQIQQSLTPKPIKIKEGQAIFVDFKVAKYEISYDIAKKSTSYRASIRFTSDISGYPIFDVVKSPKSIFLNGISVSSRPLVTPNQETTLRILNKAVTAGIYEMILEGEISQDFTIEKNGDFQAALWFNDQQDRSFLEKYLPTNLEYDQYQAKFVISQSGVQSGHNVYTNGTVKINKDSQMEIEFPEYFNSSSFYFHILPESMTTQVSAFYTSKKSNKRIPVTIYSLMATPVQLTQAMNQTIKVMGQLEAEVGPYPHEKLLVFLVPEDQGGIEYTGAVVSEVKNLRHEIFHQYLSKGYMPANGNAGWIDEAIATWFDHNKPSKAELNVSYNLANQAAYTRVTDNKAYTHGVDFISYLNMYLVKQNKGGLMPFLQFIAKNKIHQVYTTELFILEMEKFYNLQLAHLFKKYVY